MNKKADRNRAKKSCNENYKKFSAIVEKNFKKIGVEFLEDNLINKHNGLSGLLLSYLIN